MKLAFDPQMQIPQSAFREGGNGNKADKNAMEKVCQNFEAFFVQSMFKEMRDTVPEGGLLEDSFSGNFYREIMDKQVAMHSARRNDFGLAQALYQQYGASAEEITSPAPDSGVSHED
jgi:flagellar protein FlgJ